MAAANMVAPMKVAPVGMTMTAYLVLASLPILGGILYQLIKIAPGMKKVRTDADQSLREDLMSRIADLETNQKEANAAHREEMYKEQVRCDERMALIQAQSDAKITRLEGQIDALQRMLINAQAQSGNPLYIPATSEAGKAAQRILDDPALRFNGGEGDKG